MRQGRFSGPYDLSINHLTDLAVYQPSSAGTSLVSKVSLPAGAHLCYLTAHSPIETRDWRTIQTSATTHIEPQSGLLYMNHSCRPSVELHMYSPDATGTYPKTPPGNSGQSVKGVKDVGIAGEVKIARERGVEVGDALTFFYPSTELTMDRAFECTCGAKECLGNVAGAGKLSKEVLQKYFLNDHVAKSL